MTVRGPRGEEFTLVGPAGPVELARAPRIPAESSDDLLVVKEGRIFVCSQPSGDIRSDPSTGQGLYADDTRYLSDLHVELSGRDPITLSSSADPAYGALVDQTNPDLPGGIEQMTLVIRRARLVSEKLYDRIEIKNHGKSRAAFELQLTLAADFADMFEVRGVTKRLSRGKALAPKAVAGGVTFAYLGQDEVFQSTVVHFDPVPTGISLDDGTARVVWDLDLGSRDSAQIEIVIDIFDSPDAGHRPRDQAVESVKAAVSKWTGGSTRISCPHKSFMRVMDASVRDLRALATPIEGGQIVAAGIPWYVAPFGRDSVLTCYEMMMLNPEPARDTLIFLARHQATEDDPARDAEPGKILHELRVGELARAGLIPHTPYYGTVDATPLFLMLTAAYHRWTADIETMATLRPALEAAINWIDEFGDLDGDGFVEYQRRSAAGLENQGWKDSEDPIVHRDGTLAKGPIALVEVQGYVFLAKQRIAEVFDALGDPGTASTLRSSAEQLRKSFNEAFWMPDEGCFALALDGKKNQVGSVASNQAHCLYCDIADPDKAAGVAERLMADDMFSGWGVRTLSSHSPAYNPMSYHNGSVWPHDNAIAAAGLKRYGFGDATEQIASALFEAAVASPEFRLPELFCGFRRREGVPYVPYPVACKPQAWAAAAPVMILQSLLGISARAPDGVLTVNQPDLPQWIGRIELRGIKIATSKIGLAFTRDGDVTAFSLLERSGDITVTMQE